jgi:hypothetical protein
MAAACDGRVAMYISDVQQMIGGNVPVSFVLGLADAEQAERAFEELTDEQGIEPADPHRGVTIFHAPGEQEQDTERGMQGDTEMYYAILEDRLIASSTAAGAREAIDIALGDEFGPGADTLAMLELAGDGQMMFAIDMPALVQLGWPILLQFSQEDTYGWFPLRSLPSTNYMADTLTPEVGVLRNTGEGVLLETRGFFPGGPILPAALAASSSFIWMFFMGM